MRRLMRGALDRYMPVSDEKIGLEYKLKRWLDGSCLHPDEAHFFCEAPRPNRADDPVIAPTKIFDNVYARQVIAFGKPGDVAFAISTSGGSRNVLAALEEARRRKLVCFGLAGYGGGPMVTRGLVDHSITIDFEYIPRIQEAQASQYHILRRLVEMV